MCFIPKLGLFKTDFKFNGKFKLISFTDIFSPDSYALIEKSFNSVKWEKKESHFYQQYSSTIEPGDDHPFTGFFHADFFNSFKSKLEPLLGISLRNCLSIKAHKLITSQEIGVHNDYCGPEMGYENFRFIFQFARKDQLRSGGEISFLNSENKKDVIRKYSYLENVGVCFEITPNSYHFVAPVNGERHTLVMYLWDASKKYDGSAIEVISGK